MTIQDVARIFRGNFGHNMHLFRAPGRINLIGEHTDYNDGLVFPGSIDRYIFLAIDKSKDKKFRILSADFNDSLEWESGQEPTEWPGWAAYPLGVVRELEKLGFDIPPFKAVFGGDIPLGAGLSSSAALEMAFALGLNHLFGLTLSREQLARVGQQAEHNTVGVKCGIMDQFASALGRKGHLFKLDCRDLSMDWFPLSLDHHQLILVNSMVRHSLASSEYNQRRAACEHGVRILSDVYPKVNSLRDVDREMLDGMKQIMPMDVWKCCSYVLAENDRVEACAGALERKDIHRVGELLYQSHWGLSKEYVVSCDELDYLVELAANNPGVLGARMMGGGFGGCTINLVSSLHCLDFCQNLAADYVQKFNVEPVFYQVNLSDGASAVDISSI